MLEPEIGIAAQLADALIGIRYHHKNLVEKNKAEQNIEALRQMFSQLESPSENSGKDA